MREIYGKVILVVALTLLLIPCVTIGVTIKEDVDVADGIDGLYKRAMQSATPEQFIEFLIQYRNEVNNLSGDYCAYVYKNVKNSKAYSIMVYDDIINKTRSLIHNDTLSNIEYGVMFQGLKNDLKSARYNVIHHIMVNKHQTLYEITIATILFCIPMIILCGILIDEDYMLASIIIVCIALILGMLSLVFY